MVTKILIEGLDLAGKSTACRAVLGEVNPRPVLRRNALTEGNEVYEFADRMRKAGTVSGAVLGHLYRAAVEVDLQHYKAPDGTLLQDSTIALRSYAYYAARGVAELADAFQGYLDDKRHPDFDCAVVLTATIEARRDRLEQRKREHPEEVADDDLMVVNAPETFLRMERELVSKAGLRFGAKVVDTSKMTPVEVMETVLSMITKHAGVPHERH